MAEYIVNGAGDGLIESIRDNERVKEVYLKGNGCKEMEDLI